MRYGFVLPRGDARTAAETAALAERAGWDAFFVWEPVWGIDAWVSLTAAAMRTERIRLGTMLTPLSRMRPWKLASETATLDNLCGGRVILAVGLGALDTGFAEFGEATDRKTRAELLDEGLAVLTGLWAGQPFSFQGVHYTVQPTGFMPPPPPVQRPRIPIWVVGAWGRPKSMARAFRYDGLLPHVTDLTPALVERCGPRPMPAAIQGQGGTTSSSRTSHPATTRRPRRRWSARTPMPAPPGGSSRRGTTATTTTRCSSACAQARPRSERTVRRAGGYSSAGADPGGRRSGGATRR